MGFIVFSIIYTSLKTSIDFGGYLYGFVIESTSQTKIFKKFNPTHVMWFVLNSQFHYSFAFVGLCPQKYFSIIF